MESLVETIPQQKAAPLINRTTYDLTIPIRNSYPRRSTMPIYHFVAKVPLTAHTTVEANSLEEATEIASSEDRPVLYEEDDNDNDDRDPWILTSAWVIREVDEGPQDIRLRTVNPITT